MTPKERLLDVLSGEKVDRVVVAVTAVETALVYSRRTKEILRIMATMVSRSNIIGLNEVIEPARAGEIGKGFTIVAQEIRKLAVETSSAINDDRNMIEALQPLASLLKRWEIWLMLFIIITRLGKLIYPNT